MTKTVKLTQSIDDREVVRAYQKQNALLDKMVNKLDQVGRKGDAAGRQAGAGMRGATSEAGKFATAIGGMAASMIGIHQIASAINREFEDLRRREGAAALVTQTAAEAVRGARINFTPDATLRDNQLEATIQALAEETRTPVGLVGGALSSALSAKGSLKNDAAVDAVRQAFRLTPGDAESATTFAGRILDVAKVSDVKDAKSIAGFLTNVQASSRVTTVEQVGKTGVPAIAALTARGDTPEQAAEIFAAITQGIADVEGRKAGTATVNLGSRLGLFVPKTAGKDKRGTFTIPQGQIDAFEAAGSTSERIDVLQQSPQLARQFLGSTSFDSSSQAFIEQLVTGEAGAVRELETARRNIQPINAAQAVRFESKVARLEGGKFQGVLTGAQETAAAVEKLELGGTLGPAGQANATFETTIEKIDLLGFDAVARYQLRAQVEARRRLRGMSAPQAAADVLESLNNPQNSASLLRRDETPEVREFLRTNIAILRKLQQTLEESQTEPQKVEVVNPGGQQRVKPAAAANNRGGD